ncbi:MAG: 16S rRNA (cytidine(1402)-2'-O)-methyltransferase, partial [Patescibacteria group bacterium]
LMMGILYLVSTPIGNLEDISMRALRVLGSVDLVLCEDTRVTRKLLEHYKIKTPTSSYHEHTDQKKTDEIMDLLARGKNLALVTDAGTPGISDPGGKLIYAAIERFEIGADPESPVQIESIPGPSAITAALSISGVPTDKFIFMGFPPHKKGRQTFLKKIIESEYPVIVYESKHRIIKFLEELKRIGEGKIKVEGEKEEEFKVKKKIDLTSIVVCRELTKMHETVYRGDLDSIIEKIEGSADAQKGEFVVIIGK